ncbi:MAG: hypothetical protein JNM86_13830 [Phycisphaerae bacterium]|nr:hypothetical protein [Phycisphaerae bacterium]
MANLRFRAMAFAVAMLAGMMAGHGVVGAPAAPSRTSDAPGQADPVKPSKEDGNEIPVGSFDLRPKFRMGQDRRVRLSLDSKETKPDLTAELDPARKPNDPKAAATDEMKTKQDFVLVFKPVKVSEDGTSEVSIVFEQIRSHVEGPGVDESFDSSKPAPAKPKTPKPAESDPFGGLGKTPTLEETLRPLVGESLSVVFDRDGNVTEVRGGQKFVRALNPMAPEEMMQMGGDEKMRDLFKSIVSTEGKRYAKPGESWSTDTSLDVFPIGGSRLRTDYKLSNVQGAKGKITFQGKLVPSKDASPGSGGLKLSKVDYGGSTDWDQEDGFARSMQSSQALDAELKIGDQVISLKQSQKMTMERLPDGKKR